MKTLTNDAESYSKLLSAVQKTRSVAAEGGYLDLLLDRGDGLPGLDPWVGNPKTVELLADLATGARTTDQSGFRNICWMAERSSSTALGLAILGYELP